MGEGGLDGLARLLVLMGVLCVVVGLALWMLGRLPFVGHLPGDIVLERDGVRFYAPLATSLLLSLLLTVLLNLLFARRLAPTRRRGRVGGGSPPAPRRPRPGRWHTASQYGALWRLRPLVTPEGGGESMGFSQRA